MTTRDEARDGEIPPHAPPGGLIGALLAVYIPVFLVLGAVTIFITR